MINEWESNYYVIADLERDLKRNRDIIIQRGLRPNEYLESYFNRHTDKYGVVPIETIDSFRLAVRRLFTKHIY
jgi:hypothetical protein